jgi:hypothetical protein
MSFCVGRAKSGVVARKIVRGLVLCRCDRRDVRVGSDGGGRAISGFVVDGVGPHWLVLWCRCRTSQMER